MAEGEEETEKEAAVLSSASVSEFSDISAEEEAEAEMEFGSGELEGKDMTSSVEDGES